MFSKRFSPLVVALAALNAGFAQALGLGEITLHSQLDQPLNAEIRLRGMGDLDPEQIIVRLAPAVDFERSGVDRLYSLTEMRFDVRPGKAGEGVVQIRTEQPVREPYLDFLIEVRWPSGRVLREYTVLLDLPTYSAEAPPAVRAPDVAAPARSARAPRAETGGTWSGGSSYDVHSGDTLWSIASRTRPSGVSVQQMLQALHRDNPEAFVNGDIDRLRAGVVLRVPADVAAGAAAVGGAGVDGGAPQLAQESSPLSTGVEASSGTAPATPEEQAYLRLAGDKTPPGASATGGEPGGTGDGSAAGQGDLAAVQENLSAKERENAELASRVKALEEQVQNYQRVVDLKSDAMAAAQTGATAPAASAASPAPTPKPPVAPAPEPGVLDMLLANGVALGATLGALFLGVLGFLVLRRRGETATYGALPDVKERYRAVRRESEPEASGAREPIVPPAPSAAAAPVPASPRPAAVFPAPVVAPVATASAVELGASPEQDQREREVNDPIGEADIYTAYGRHERALEVLRLALAGDPERSDVRLKLLEVLAERGDQAAFLAEYDQLLALGQDDDVAAGREIAIGTGHPHWLAELDAPPGIQSAPELEQLSPLPARRLSRALPEDEPAAELASLDLEEQGLPPAGDFDLDLDLDLDADLDAGDHEVVDEEDLSSGFGELDIGELDIAGASAAEALPSVADAVPDMIDVEPAGTDISAVPESISTDAEDLLAPTAADAEEEAADFDLLEGTDEVETRIELAKAFIDMGDVDGARDILEEVVAEGSQAQREAATALLDTLKPA